MNFDTREVSAVICTWNAENIIEQCLASLRKNNVGEIVLVDASSTDKTRQIASSYVDNILTDPREGLARARNIGIAKTKGKYILNFGSDNVFPEGSLSEMLGWLIERNFSGVSAVTHLRNSQESYLAKAMNRYKQARFYPGEKEVIGTPTLFRADLLKKHPYDDKMGWSDDSDLCDRLRPQGHRFAISDALVLEVGSETLKSVIYRWKGYGRSDWEIYKKYSKTWTLTRKLKSFVHPLMVELIQPFLRTKGSIRINLLPFLLVITSIRYFSWIKHALSGLSEEVK